MSLFDGTHGGDIWSTGAFLYDSPMKDLLDGGEYTLEQLLREDELLQEVKSMQPQLIDFLAQGSSVARLVDYLVTPFDDGGTGGNGGPDADESSSSLRRSDNGEDGIEYEGTGASFDGGDSSAEKGEEAGDKEAEGEGGGEVSTTDGDEVVESASLPQDDSPNGDDEAATTTRDASPSQEENVPHEEAPTKEEEGCNDEERTDTFPVLEAEEGSLDDILAKAESKVKFPLEKEVSTTSAFDWNDSTNDISINLSSNIGDDHDDSHDEDDDENEGQQHHEEDNSTAFDSEEDQTLRQIRYPYMACEIVCCENSRIIDLLVDGTYEDEQQCHDAEHHSGNDGCRGGVGGDGGCLQQASFLDRLFTLLDLEPNRMDDRLAGYFEKVLMVLFRMRSATLSEYMNARRDVLLPKFVQHLGSFAIMQVLQRLVLPEPRPPGMGQNGGGSGMAEQDGMEEGEEIAPGENDDDSYENRSIFRCSWGSQLETSSLLVEQLIQSDGWTDQGMEVASHSSELLVALVQQAPLDSDVLKMLSSLPVLGDIIQKATVVPEGQVFTPHESPMTSAMNLVEAIVLQLGGFGCVPPVNESLSISFQMNPAAGTPPTEGEDGAEMVEMKDMNGTTSDGAFEEVSGDEESGDSSQEDDSSSPTSVASPDEEADAAAAAAAAAKVAPDVDETEGRVNASANVVSCRWRNLANPDDLQSLLPTALLKWKSWLEHDVTKTWTLPNSMGDSHAKQLGASRLRVVRLLEALVLLAHPGVDEELIRSDVLEICLDLFFEFPWCNMLHQSVANLLVHVLESGSRRTSLQAYLIHDLGLLRRLLDGYDRDTDGEAKRINDEPTATESDRNRVGDNVFRLGYMGHLIIICQAIVHACSPGEAPNPSNVSTEAVVSNSRTPSEDGIVGTADAGGENTNGNGGAAAATAAAKSLNPLSTLIAESDVSDRWERFVSTSLAAVTAVQSTPLGGTFPPPRDGPDSPLGMQATDGPEATGTLEMNNDDLDIAVTMMDALHLPPSRAGELVGENGQIELEDKPMGMLNGGHSTGLSTSAFDKIVAEGSRSTTTDYFSDDPFGRDDLARKFFQDEDEEEDDDDEDGSGGGDQDVPVLNLFTGNFHVDPMDADNATPASAVTIDASDGAPDSWSNFAAFDSDEVVQSTGEVTDSAVVEPFEANFDAFGENSPSDANNNGVVDEEGGADKTDGTEEESSTEGDAVTSATAKATTKTDDDDPFGDTERKFSIDDLF